MNKFIKKAAILITGTILLSGCATYRFQHGKPPLDKGYVAFRDDRQILEYTIGKDNTVPGIKLAKERFKRRRNVVEDYYKRMGLIQNHFTMAFWEQGITFVKIVGGIFRLPFVAISDYRYEHNPKYKEIVEKREARQDLREAERVKKLKDKLSVYVQKDLEKEVPKETPLPKKEAIEAALDKQEQEPPKEAPKAQEPVEQKAIEPEQVQAPAATAPVEEEKIVEQPEQVQAPVVTAPVEEEKAVEPEQVQAPSATVPVEEEKPVEPVQVQAPAVTVPAEGVVKAVIIAKPLKGYSPLRVQFDGRKSSSMHGRVVSYTWDFGDGEISTKSKSVNIYWSTTYGSRYFTATLTVKDDKGNSAVSNTTIEVMTR